MSFFALRRHYFDILKITKRTTSLTRKFAAVPFSSFKLGFPRKPIENTPKISNSDAMELIALAYAMIPSGLGNFSRNAKA